MAAFEIRPMGVAEADPTAALVESVIWPLGYYSDEAKRAECAKYNASELRALAIQDPYSVLLARANSSLTGFCISRYDDGVIWLSWFGVHADFRGNGVGSMLLETLDEASRARGCRKIWCDTRTDNIKSQRVLERAGYSMMCTVTDHWYGLDFHLWEKRL